MFYCGMEQISNSTLSKYLTYPKSTPDGSTRLKLFYTNDWHGQTDNMGGILGGSLQFDSSTKGQKLDTLKLVAGDSWSGANTKKNNLILNLMNYMGFDACTLGNHELDAGTQAMEQIVNNSSGTKFISSNLKKQDGSNPKGVENSFIKEVNGNKYGIIGLSPLDLKTVVATEKIPDINVHDLNQTIAAAQDEINKMKAQGVNKIIILSHVGKDLDIQLASQLDGVDIIVGGHSHDKIENIKEGQNLVRSKSGEPVVILQTGQNAQNYGILDAEFDINGILTRVSNSVIETNKSKNSIIENIKSKEVGVSPSVATIEAIDPLPENRRIAPSAWTAMMADSMREELGTDVAIINSANIRKVPQIGKLTVQDVEESAPMKNSLLKTQMSEDQIVSAIKNAAWRSFGATDGYPGLLQCSGIEYTIDTNGNLLSLSFIDKSGAKTPVDVNNPSKTKMYSVALDSFLANGKEYPEMIPKGQVEKFEIDKDTTMINMLKKRADKDKLIIKDDGRLKIVQTSQPPRQSSNTRNI